MYYLRLMAKPQETHPEFQSIGDTSVACWVDYPTEKEALEATRDAMAEAAWDIVEIEEVELVARDEFDEELVEYYDQAVMDQEVYVFDQSPRFPVFFIRYRVREAESQKECDAEVWIVNEAVDGQRDPFDAEFWSAELVETTVAITTDTLKEENYTVLEIVDKFPCCRDDFADSERIDFYDEAEEHGMCICIAEDGEDAEE